MFEVHPFVRFTEPRSLILITTCDGVGHEWTHVFPDGRVCALFYLARKRCEVQKDHTDLDCYT